MGEESIILSGGQLTHPGDSEGLQGFLKLFPEYELEIEEDPDLGMLTKLTEEKVLDLLERHPEKRINLLVLLAEELRNLQSQYKTPQETLERYLNNPRMTPEKRIELEEKIDRYQLKVKIQIENMQNIRKYVENLPELRDQVRDAKDIFLSAVPNTRPRE